MTKRAPYIDTRIVDDVEKELQGFINGAPAETTRKLRDLLFGMLRSQKPTAIKENLPRLVRLVEMVILDSIYPGPCPKCGCLSTRCHGCGRITGDDLCQNEKTASSKSE